MGRRDGILLLAMTLVFLNFWDAICTIFLVEGHWAREVNPFMRFFLDKSWLLFFCVKMGLCGIGGALALAAPRNRERAVLWTFGLLNLLYLGIVVHNLRMVCMVLGAQHG
jgi:hypothetical protein